MTKHTSPVKGVLIFSDASTALNGTFCLISETIEFNINMDSSIIFFSYVSSVNKLSVNKLICIIILLNKINLLIKKIVMYKWH